ncbi:MAG: fumarylacetoacetate hydrolase family protein [candidate division WOR-3 bacterium]|jgi:2-keto-4-pentenoate hydratase/2-oxohepta-3-ene-1,7-dioic acid hydratase in catechol pathway
MIILLDEQEYDLRPSKIIAVARNYRAHAEEMKSEVPKEPHFFLKPPSSLLENNGEVILPKASARVDHEVELAVIMKTRTSKVTPENAKKNVLGYTVLVDVTARDIQARAKQKGMPWTISKGFDTFAPIGPNIVPVDAVDERNLDIWLRINREYKQRGNTNQMIFSVEQLVSYVSHIMTLEPMDIIATGTPSGVGPMQDGDIVEAGIEHIGVLQFKAVREP